VTDISFYHLQAEPLDRALPRLLEKVLEREYRTLIRGTSEERLTSLDESLWTYKSLSFLPHGREGEGDPATQPIFLTRDEGNQNSAQVIVLIEDAPAPDIDIFDRCLYMFDGEDEGTLAAARVRWKAFKDQELSVNYYQQTETGWQKKA